MALELTPKPILSPEPVPNAKAIPAPQAVDSTLPYSTIFKQPLFKPVNTPRYTTYVSPTSHSNNLTLVVFPPPPAAFHSALPGYKTIFIPTLPTPSPVLPGGYGSAMPAPFKPAQLVPSWFPVASPPPCTSLDASRHPLGGGYCQGFACRCCLCLIFIWLSCVLTHCFVFVCLPRVPVIPTPCFP